MEKNNRQEKTRPGKLLNRPLEGFSIAIQENISMEGILTTAGSKILENYKPIFNAHIIDKLNKAGAIIVGKTKMSEFDLPGQKPKDNTLAQSLASGQALIGLGSDLGGSLGQAAVEYGLIGLKTSYGLISRHGLISLTSSLEQIGLMGKRVEDFGLTLEVLEGHDLNDPNTVRQGPKKYSQLSKNIQGQKIGLVRESFGAMDLGEKEKLEKMLEDLREKGAIIEDLSLSFNKYAKAVYHVICSGEARSNMGRYDGLRYGMTAEGSLEEVYDQVRDKGFGQELKEKIEFGGQVLRGENYEKIYLKAMKIRRLISKEMMDGLEKHDLILMAGPGNLYPSLTGLPAISLPYQRDKKNQGQGIQFIGRPYGEMDILEIAYVWEEIIGREENHGK